MEKRACFIGHRKIEQSVDLINRLTCEIRRLITEESVAFFLFGSGSDFDSLCHSIVTSLQTEFPNIRRVAYTCKHELACMKEDKEEMERRWSHFLNEEVHIKDYDAEYSHPTKYTAGRGNYVERNMAMIDDSDFCMFYYDKNYLPLRRKNSPGDLSDYQPKSGTKIAYDYAVQKNKTIINAVDML